MAQTRIALVGDFNPRIVAHQAILKCFALADGIPSLRVASSWVDTDKIGSDPNEYLNAVNGVWCVPGSPYRDTVGALNAIRWARSNRVPFLGTCGGMQHAVLEYARNVLGLAEAAHAENEPATSFPLLDRLACSLIESGQRVRVTGENRFRDYYGVDSALETFHCNYGLNPKFENLFEAGALQIAARAEDGGVRAIELRGHPFFIATLFQPERQALSGSLHPIVQAFFAATRQAASTQGAST